jgi:hypothetical protein
MLLRQLSALAALLMLLSSTGCCCWRHCCRQRSEPVCCQPACSCSCYTPDVHTQAPPLVPTPVVGTSR